MAVTLGRPQGALNLHPRQIELDGQSAGLSMAVTRHLRPAQGIQAGVLFRPGPGQLALTLNFGHSPQLGLTLQLLLAMQLLLTTHFGQPADFDIVLCRDPAGSSSLISLFLGSRFRRRLEHQGRRDQTQGHQQHAGRTIRQFHGFPPYPSD